MPFFGATSKQKSGSTDGSGNGAPGAGEVREKDRNVSFKPQDTTAKLRSETFASTSDTDLDRVLDSREDLDALVRSESDASVGAMRQKLFDMHLTFRQHGRVPRNHHSNRALWFVQTLAFKHFINVIILLSAIQMGLAADFQGGDWDTVWKVCGFVFTSIFVLEMALKLLGLGLTYFFDGWNCLDFFVAWASIVDVWIMPAIYDDKDGPQILILFRSFRLLRIVKMLRVVPELMLVVEGIVASLRSMFWVFLLLGVILYTVGIYCVEAIGSENAGYEGWDNDMAIEETVVDTFNNFLFFGSVSRSMVSLFGLVLLSEWSPVVRPVWEKQPMIVLVFIGLVILTTFGVLNVIIGVVVERTTAAMNQVREKDVARKKREQTKAFHDISTLMFDLDTDKDKKVSKQEMENGANNQNLHDLLQKVDFPHGFTYGEFHAMLDQDGSGYLSRSEFINGMLRLVYNDQFQRDCMFQLTMGQIKANQCKLHRETKTYTEKLYLSIKREIDSLRADLNLPKARKRSSGVEQPVGVSSVYSSEKTHTLWESTTSPAGEGLPSKGSISLGLKSLFPQADLSNKDSNSVLVQPVSAESSLNQVEVENRQKGTKSMLSTKSAVSTAVEGEGDSRAKLPTRTLDTMDTEDVSSLFYPELWEPVQSEAVPAGLDIDENLDGESRELRPVVPTLLPPLKEVQRRDGNNAGNGAFFVYANDEPVDSRDSGRGEQICGRILSRCSGREGYKQTFREVDTETLAAI